MPSASLGIWQNARRISLDEIEVAHASVGGTLRGRRYATQQINHAYVMLLSSQFQGFCRDLHSESVDAIVRNSPSLLQPVIEDGLRRDRRLDRGNPSPGNLGMDFGRFDFSFWATVYTLHRHNARRRAMLEELNEWRNAIAHQDFVRVGSSTIQLQQVRRWRKACDELATYFDQAAFQQLVTLTGIAPW